jgi:predicted Fe-Mo cluster-binding NifX family protein
VNETPVKIVVSAASPRLDSIVDQRFGRAAHFVVVNLETMEWQAHSNPGVGASGGAGSYAAQFIANLGVQAVISGDFGPNAYNALRVAGVAMYLLGDSRNIQETVQQFKSGSLAQAGAPTPEGHHSN